MHKHLGRDSRLVSDLRASLLHSPRLRLYLAVPALASLLQLRGSKIRFSPCVSSPALKDFRYTDQVSSLAALPLLPPLPPPPGVSLCLSLLVSVYSLIRCLLGRYTHRIVQGSNLDWILFFYIQLRNLAHVEDIDY
ncbi:hypothetical protein SAY86_030338 [Trapa natans]|uniref:Uncharacterized protein n=1 Tax=Trapa natans TaxID=22666 RepID=A0AAN7M4W5_TRANT|nr:hypothetical protein SAY86_030338 [Trapa natans]